MAEAIDDAGKFLLSEIRKLGSFMDGMNGVITKNGLTTPQFTKLRQKSANMYSSSQKTKMKKIRNSVPHPTKDTIMQKVVPYEDMLKYLDGRYNTIGGYVTRAQDTKMLSKYMDYYNSLRLDYKGTKFKPKKDKTMGVIRFKTTEVNKLSIPYSKAMGGNTKGQLPWTGNGFTSAKNGNAIPEYTFPERYLAEPLNGAELFEVDKFGNEVLKAVYIDRLEKFVPVK